MEDMDIIPPPPPSPSFENIWHIYFVAAPDNPQRISTATDGGGSTQQRVCVTNSKFRNVHGCSLLNVPAGVFYSLLASVSPISKRRTENLFSKASILFRSANTIYTIYTNSKNYLPLANTHRPTLVDTVSILFASAYINSG